MKTTKMLITCAALMLLVSCKKEIKRENLKNSVNDSPGNTVGARSGSPIIVTANVLDFKSLEVFDSLLVELEKQQTEYTSTGFTSLYHTFTSALAAESLAESTFISSYSSETEALTHLGEYESSTEFENNKDVMLDATFSDGQHYYKMNVPYTTIAKLVNRDGFVIIGDHLVRYTKDTIYISVSPFTTSLPTITTGNTGSVEFQEYAANSEETSGTCVCNNGFERSNSTTDGNGKFRTSLTVSFYQSKSPTLLQVIFNPALEGQSCVNKSSLKLSGAHYKKHTLGNYWALVVPDKLTFSGYSSPQNGRSINGNQYSLNLNLYSYEFPSVSSATFYHFNDNNEATLPCLNLVSGSYNCRAYSGVNYLGTTVSW